MAKIKRNKNKIAFIALAIKQSQLHQMKHWLSLCHRAVGFWCVCQRVTVLVNTFLHFQNPAKWHLQFLLVTPISTSCFNFATIKIFTKGTQYTQKRRQHILQHPAITPYMFMHLSFIYNIKKSTWSKDHKWTYLRFITLYTGHTDWINVFP